MYSGNFFFPGQIGFLEEIRRSNVAITRARRHLALIGDSVTLSHEPFLKGMLNYCAEQGEVWTAQEYISGQFNYQCCLISKSLLLHFINSAFSLYGFGIFPSLIESSVCVCWPAQG